MAELVAIKGSREGLRVQLDEAAEWPQVLASLRSQLVLSGSFFDGAQLTVDVGERSLGDTQLAELLALLQEHGLRPHALAATTRESRNAARAVGITARPPVPRAPTLPTGGEDAGLLVRRTVRSGQVVRHTGPITVIGDVNAGAEIISGGSVVVWGRLRGVVHAGALGDRAAVICALELRPTQLRIADLIAQGDRAPGRTPEVASVEHERISVESWEAHRKS